mmetsp:Transcript_4869/g.14330  ORF Transcript_4869/g.14330 Transcript_4869/m.14330 type:complete len:244 (-) Transcript_4869:69-800(-)
MLPVYTFGGARRRVAAAQAAARAALIQAALSHRFCLRAALLRRSAVIPHRPAARSAFPTSPLCSMLPLGAPRSSAAFETPSMFRMLISSAGEWTTAGPPPDAFPRLSPLGIVHAQVGTDTFRQDPMSARSLLRFKKFFNVYAANVMSLSKRGFTTRLQKSSTLPTTGMTSSHPSRFMKLVSSSSRHPHISRLLSRSAPTTFQPRSCFMLLLPTVSKASPGTLGMKRLSSRSRARTRPARRPLA